MECSEVRKYGQGVAGLSTLDERIDGADSVKGDDWSNEEPGCEDG